MNSNKTALITGASSGIGYEIAKEFQQKGYDLVLVSQNPKRLKQAVENLKALNDSSGKDINITGIVVNLAKAEAAEELFKKVKNKKIKIDVLVNNAGIGYFDQVVKMDLEKIEEMISLNTQTLTKLSYLYAKEMHQTTTSNTGSNSSDKGVIVNIASVLGFIPMAYTVLYAATKAFVIHFTEGISEEMKDSGVRFLVVCPGSTRTAFFDRARGEKEVNRDGGVFKLNQMMAAEEVAQQTVEAVEKQKVVLVNGFKNKCFVFLPRLVPRSWVRFIAGTMGRLGLKH